jgi:hypothetical protein
MAVIVSAQSVQHTDSISYLDIDFKKALKISKKSKKKIMIFFSIANNDDCLKFEESYIKNKAVVDLYNSEFINIRPILDSKKGSSLVNEFNVKYFPCIVFVNSKKEVIDRIIGSIRIQEGIAISSNVIKNKETLKYYRDIYLKEKGKGNYSRKALLHYANKLYDTGGDYTEVIDKYFSLVDEPNLSDPNNIDAIIKFSDNIYSREFTFLARNLMSSNTNRFSNYEKTYKVETSISAKCIAALKENKEINIEDTLFSLMSYFNLMDNENVKLRVLMDYQRDILGNNTEYFNLLYEYTNMNIHEMDAKYINNTCLEIYETNKDKMLIDQALMWNSEALTKEYRIEYFYTRVLLLKRLERKEELDYIYNKVMREEEGELSNYWKDKFRKVVLEID